MFLQGIHFNSLTVQCDETTKLLYNSTNWRKITSLKKIAGIELDALVNNEHQKR